MLRVVSSVGFDSEQWLYELIDRLDKAFGERILFIGHIGSYARGEATEDSDIDVNVILDTLTMDDLRAYRRIIRDMPHREKACGFICGREEIKAWPTHELFQFTQGCRNLHGSLDGLIAPPGDEDIRDSIRNLASSIYHQCNHSYLFGEDLASEAEGLRFAYKTTFFVLQEWVFLNEGRYIPTKREMLSLVRGDDLEVLSISMRWSDLADDRGNDPERYFSLLREWSGTMLQNVRELRSAPSAEPAGDA